MLVQESQLSNAALEQTGRFLDQANREMPKENIKQVQLYHRSNAALEIAGDFLDQANREAQGRVDLAIFNIIWEMSGIFTTLQSQKMVLESGNRTLEHEIRQLKSAHTLELNTVIDGWAAKHKLIIEKLRAILERLNQFSTTYEYCNCF